MDEQEIINALRIGIGNELIITSSNGNHQSKIEFLAGLGEAISALEELGKYRAIGTVEECEWAIEKQEAKKPIEVFTKKEYECVECGSHLLVYRMEFCPCCGQRIDWSEEE